MSATSATLIHDAISNPTEVIKQRLQMYNSPYKSVMECAKKVFQQEGFSAFYRSYTTQLVMNLPYQAIHFTTYEFFQETVCLQIDMFTFRSDNKLSFCDLVEQGARVFTQSSRTCWWSGWSYCCCIHNAAGRLQDAS